MTVWVYVRMWKPPPAPKIVCPDENLCVVSVSSFCPRRRGNGTGSDKRLHSQKTSDRTHLSWSHGGTESLCARVETAPLSWVHFHFTRARSSGSMVFLVTAIMSLGVCANVPRSHPVHKAPRALINRIAGSGHAVANPYHPGHLATPHTLVSCHELWGQYAQ